MSDNDVPEYAVFRAMDLLVAAAGGEIRVPDRLGAELPRHAAIYWYYDPRRRETVYRVDGFGGGSA